MLLVCTSASVFYHSTTLDYQLNLLRSHTIVICQFSNIQGFEGFRALVKTCRDTSEKITLTGTRAVSPIQFNMAFFVYVDLLKLYL